MANRAFVIILGAGLVTAVITGGVFLLNQGSTPTPTPTPSSVPDDWQTYRNEEYGIEFPYPQNWNLSAETKDGWLFVDATPLESTSALSPQIRVRVGQQDTVGQNSSTISTLNTLIPIYYRDHYEEIRNPLSKEEWVEVKNFEATIENIRGARIIESFRLGNPGEGRLVETWIYHPQQKRLIMIGYHSLENSQAIRDIYEEILEAFKLL